MFNQHRHLQFEKYNDAKSHLLTDYEILVQLEKYVSDFLFASLENDFDSIKNAYNEASYLYPFWQNYPPDERGRSPKGDQFPWIEVGEHAVGTKIFSYFNDLNAKDIGLPTGPDQRFVIQSSDIAEITKGLTDSAWVFIDIKSVGPRDDFDHTVMSHNQISGDGIWQNKDEGLRNTILTATGSRATHDFHCSVPPLYVLSDGTVLPVIMLVVKPVYRMLSLENPTENGQPLDRITVVTIPNGLLLVTNLGYLRNYPGLLFPGKDDKGKNPLKVRARISFPLLRLINDWRVRDLK